MAKSWKKVKRNHSTLEQTQKSTNLRRINDRIRRTTVDLTPEQRIKYVREALGNTLEDSVKLSFTPSGYLSSKTKTDYKRLVDALPTASKLQSMVEAVNDKTYEKLSEHELRTAMASIMQHFFYEYYEGEGDTLDIDKIDPKALSRFAEEEGYEIDYKKLRDKMKEIGRTYRQTAAPIDLIPLIQDAQILMRKNNKKNLN